MLEYLKSKAKEEGVKIETVRADMRNFKLNKKVDFAFILMGTIGYVDSNKAFLNHLDSVARCLRKGGLYLIENFALDWSKNLFKPQKWTMKKNNIKVKALYKAKLIDTLNQTIKEILELEVYEKEKKFTLKEKWKRKLIFPQELLVLLRVNNKFEFLGWFEHNRLVPLTKAKNFNYIILRRK
jgi:SAM-dependent methyltransferase